MAVRLQMKLGLVAEHDRLQDSPDTTVVVEPTVGSTARSKGSLYLIVTGPPDLPRARDATRLVAETIRDEYFYDESAGIQVVLTKVIRSANRRLTAQRERLGLGQVTDEPGPVGLGLAVVRGNELYVVTVGPVDAFLIRQARLLTLPDPHRERGLPTKEIAPHVWRGEITVGDTVALLSSNVTERVGPDDLKDSLVTLHPRSAMEHVHHRFVAADGSGSDAALAFEAAEVASTHKRSELIPVHPDEPLAGRPERSPIPLADSLSGGVAAVSGTASKARRAAGGAVSGGFSRIQDLLPRRSQPSRTVTPVSSRREGQRRLAIAALVLIAVVAAIGVGIFLLGGGKSPEVIAEVTAGQKALESAQEAVRLVFDNGSNLVEDDPAKALQLLTNAYGELRQAAAAGIPTATIVPIQARVVSGMDTLYGVVEVGATQLFSFEKANPPISIGSLVRGPDGAPVVLDTAGHAVYRVDLRTRKAARLLKAGSTIGSLKAGQPQYLALGGPDLLMLDSKNVLWRWRAIDKKGNGTLARVNVTDSTNWGKDIRAIGTFLRDADAGLYNLYVVDPSSQQILRYSPAADGSGFPAASSDYLAAPQDVSGISELFIDGDLWAVDGTEIARFSGGQRARTSVADPGDEILRPTSSYGQITGYGATGEGVVYAWDRTNRRVIATDKATGKYLAQYRLAVSPERWDDIRGMYVLPPVDGGAPVLVWADGTRLWQTPLEAVARPGPTSSPGATASPSSSLSPSQPATPASPSTRPATPSPSP